MTKKEANYRETDGQKRCGNCSMFRPWKKDQRSQGGCTLVVGIINSEDTCDHWEKKK